LHLMHVLPGLQPDERGTEWIESGADSTFHRVIQRMQDAVPGEVYRRCMVLNAVRWGKPYSEVLTYMRQQNIDLVCMGALGRDFGSEALFGSNADRVLRQAPSHVLIARPLNPAMCAPLDPRRRPLFDA
jgi:nucleotide-binding universal stress UspA family protein